MSRETWRAARGLVLLGVIGTLPGCERGCARIDEARRAVAPGAGGATPSGSSPRIDLAGTDCSDGLARCLHGAVEVSRLAHLPSPCTAPGTSPERGAGACECPWDAIGPCRHGCALEGAVVVVGPEAARAQLCRPGPDELPSHPPGPDELARVEVCPEEGAQCRDGIVHRCERAGAPSRVLGVCTHGCATDVAGFEAGEALPTDGLVSILCRRSTAERR